MANSVLQDTDYANLRGAYGYLGVDPLTTQQEMVVLTHLRGVPISVAARAAGMSPSTAYELMKRPDMDVIKDFFRQQLMDQVVIDMNMLNTMALEAHRKSANATEELKAVETLGKINQVGAYAAATTLKSRADQEVEKEIGPKSAKQLEQMPQDELMKLANFDGLDSLDPVPKQRTAGTPVEVEGEIVDEQ